MNPTSAQKLRSTAYHEAGHAVAAFHLGIGIGRKGVSVIPDRSENRDGSAHILKGFAGRPDIEITDRMRLGAEKHAIATFAGEAAQRRFRASSVRRWHGSGDRRRALDLLSYFAPEKRELKAYCRWLQIRAENLIASHLVWADCCAVADALVERRHLTPHDVRTICRQTYQSAFEAHLRESAAKHAPRSL
jgi:hypothetical protein